jgi:RNA polymerase sigma factor (sigma-70 family)
MHGDGAGKATFDTSRADPHTPDSIPTEVSEPTSRPNLSVRALLDAHAPAIARVLRRIAGPTCDVEALTNDVLYRFMMRSDAIYSDDHIRAYVRAIAHFVAREDRRRARRNRMLVPLVTAEIAAFPYDGQDSADASVREVFSSLRTDLRTVLVLRYIEGLNLHELACRARLSVSTVQRRLRDAERAFSQRAASAPELRERKRPRE